jgi:hypothetical protein
VILLRIHIQRLLLLNLGCRERHSVEWEHGVRHDPVLSGWDIFESSNIE